MEINSKEQYYKFIGYIDEYIPNRATALKEMYSKFGERLITAPASSINFYHNAFPGGYLDHVLRVTDIALKMYDFYEDYGMDVTGFTKSNLVFVALNHDLGKLGFVGEGREKYILNDSDWHVKHQGKVYKYNDKIPFAVVSDLSLYTLQKYGVTVEFEEYIAIKIHDGLYEEGNKPYFISRTEESGLRTNLAYIVHMSDLMASKHEYKLWKHNGNIPKPNAKKQEVKKDNFAEESDKALDDFKQMFNKVSKN
jgi:hypothetical protein